MEASHQPSDRRSPLPCDNSQDTSQGAAASPLADLSLFEPKPSPARTVEVSLSRSSPAASLAADQACDAVKVLPRAQIREIMRTRGFPELERHWRFFEAQKREPESIDAPQLERARSRHMSPLLGYPRLALAASFGALLSGGIYLGQTVLPYTHEFATAGNASLALLYAASGSLLVSMLAAAAQRRFLFPFEKICATDVGFMLGQRDLREHLYQTPRFISARKRLDALGVSSAWDDPSYQRAYQSVRGEIREVKQHSRTDLVHLLLRDFIGFFDPERRKFFEGRYTKDLMEGKRTANAFFAHHRDTINKSKEGALTVEEGAALLRELAPHLRESSKRAQLAEGINSILTDGTRPGTLTCRVWSRDPWVDLTHQLEFYSSASLRGVKLMGRGSKGRLGPFGYLRNPSISALDFSVDGKRTNRARLGAAVITDGNGKERPVLFVDGVEGTNAVKPEMIRHAIEAYARECGFHAVLYNRLVLNKTPQRFVRSLEKAKLPIAGTKIAYVDSSEREYLDAFGAPIEPFEYMYPRGRVIVHVSRLHAEPLLQEAAPGLWHRTEAFVRKNCLWIWMGANCGLATLSITHTDPLYMLPFGAVVGLGIWGNRWYQRLSLRRAPKSGD